MGIRVAGHADSAVSAAGQLLRIEDMATRQGQNREGIRRPGRMASGVQRESGAALHFIRMPLPSSAAATRRRI
jgi:hypothetical protein